MNLGISYMNGLGVIRNPAEGGRWFQKVSDLQKSSPGAYQHIMMTPETIETARLCHQRAEAGDPEAQHSLYWIYKLGMGVSQNDQEAQKWFSRAATSQRTHR
jgi:TPR repeat protein